MDLKSLPGRGRNLSEGDVAWVGADYSQTHKENDALAEDLEETLEHIGKDESRSLAANGEKLQQVRKQVEVISRLQDAVNAANPGDSATLVHNTRAGANRYNYNELETSEFILKPKLSKTEIRLNIERDKFSAKSLFNRRGQAGLDVGNAAKFVNASAILSPSFEDERLEEEHEFFNDDDDQMAHHPVKGNTVADKRSLTRTRTMKPQKPQKGYLRETTSSQHGRPRTAIGSSTTDDLKYDDILPPRSQSAMRSRSRRELEILSRIAVKDDEPLVDEYGLTNWKAVYERRRKNRLKELKTQGEVLQSRVKGFVAELDIFNKRPRTAWK